MQIQPPTRAPAPAEEQANEVEFEEGWRKPTTEVAWINYLAEHEVPDQQPYLLGRRYFQLLFAISLAICAQLCLMDMPPGSLAHTGPLLLACGRISGLFAGTLLLTQVLLMSRMAWLDRWIGGHALMTWHKMLGRSLLVLVLAHIVFTLLGYAYLADTSPGREAFELLGSYSGMVLALVGTMILLLTGLLAIRAIRRRMRYETWYYLHLSTYLILLLVFGHQFALGRELHGNTFGHWYWLGLYVFVVAGLFAGRIVRPLVLNLRHQFRLAEVVDEGGGMVSLYIAAYNLNKLQVSAGQYFRWRFLAPGHWWAAHPFSLSEAPNGIWFRLTVKMVGDHTSRLPDLRPGTRILAEGPQGAATAGHRLTPRALLIAAGSGIAPIRALLEDLPRGAIVIYRASTDTDIVFREELDRLAGARGSRVEYVIGSRGDPWPRHVMSERGMRQLVPDIKNRDVYVCGPADLAAEWTRTLRRFGVPRGQIHLDVFEF